MSLALWLVLLLWPSLAWATNEPLCVQLPALACTAGEADYAGTHDFSGANLDVGSSPEAVLFQDASGYVTDDGTDFCYESATNELGIGTCDPDGQIHLYKNAAEDVRLRLKNAANSDGALAGVSIAANAAGLGINCYNSSQTTGSPRFGSLSLADQCYLEHSGGTGTFVVGTGGSQDFYIVTAQNPRIRVTSTGSIELNQQQIDADTIIHGNGLDVFTVDAGTKEVLLKGPLFIDEQAAANADRATYGQLWIKTATPNELWFTDDAGNDVQISILPSGSDVLAYWDNSVTAWETRDPTTDFTEDGTNFSLNSNVSEWGAVMGDESEVYNGATVPLVASAGDMGIDTTQDQLVYYGSAEAVIEPAISKCFPIEVLEADDDDFLFFSYHTDVTVVGAWCLCQGTCTTEADLSFENDAGTEFGTGDTVDCEDTTTGDTLTTIDGANTLTALDGLRFDVDNAVSPETDAYLLCIKFTIDEK